MGYKAITDILPAAATQSADYQHGVLAGYHECEADLALDAIAAQPHYVRDRCALWKTVVQRRRGKDAWRPRDWFLGFVAGYLVRKENERLWVEERLQQQAKAVQEKANDATS